MIVEDNERMRCFIIKYLDNMFSDIYESKDGYSAVKMFENINPDFVLMDIEMPVMDGLQAAKIILNKKPKSNIIFLTQFDEPEYKKKAFEIGGKAFILKENLEQLPNAIKEILKNEV